MTTSRHDALRERIAAYDFPRGGGAVVRANRGYTLYSRRPGSPVARLRPTGQDDHVPVIPMPESPDLSRITDSVEEGRFSIPCHRSELIGPGIIP